MIYEYLFPVCIRRRTKSKVLKKDSVVATLLIPDKIMPEVLYMYIYRYSGHFNYVLVHFACVGPFEFDQ
jgi:hypothetical protein